LAYVPTDFRKTVVFLGKDKEGETYVCGSAFWVINVQSPQELAERYQPAYLVTAAHVIEELRQNGVGSFRIRVNLKTGEAVWLDGMSLDRWKQHPDPTVDVSILKLAIYEEWDHTGWPTTAFVTPESIEQYQEEIELGDEVFSVGVFWPHKGKTRNIPLVRIGNIAALRDERVETKQDLFSDVYLMEARSVGGLSGAPVFIDIVRARLTGREIAKSGTVFVGPFRFRLIGLISGHFTGVDDELMSTELVNTGIPLKELEKLNMGIAYVTPADKIIEGLQQFKGAEEEESRHHREPLSIAVGDTSPRATVASQLATSTFDVPKTRDKKD
jgi:hypothetical protein